MNHSKAARKFATEVFCDIIRNEACEFASSVGKRRNGGLLDILGFCWDTIIGDAKTFCPILLELVKASVTRKPKDLYQKKI